MDLRKALQLADSGLAGRLRLIGRCMARVFPKGENCISGIIFDCSLMPFLDHFQAGSIHKVAHNLQQFLFTELMHR